MERHQRNRLLLLVGIWVAVEVGLWLIGRRAPALADLAGAGYWITAVCFVIPIFRALRSRGRSDRRQSDRRSDTDEPAKTGG